MTKSSSDSDFSGEDGVESFPLTRIRREPTAQVNPAFPSFVPTNPMQMMMMMMMMGDDDFEFGEDFGENGMMMPGMFPGFFGFPGFPGFPNIFGFPNLPTPKGKFFCFFFILR